MALFLLVCLFPCYGEDTEGVPAFHRLLLSPERLPEELKRVQDGVLVRLPAAEFDDLVQRATRASKRRHPPQLLEARYHATLKEESLIGEGQWRLIHTGPGPGLLNLQPFNLALRQARFENGDALIAAFDGKNPALLVDKPGERTVSLDWSARAEPGPDGLQFHLEMPTCPVTLVELDVPAGRSVIVLNDDALLSGPHEAEKNDLRRWKIVCGGRQNTDRRRIDIRVSAAPQSSPPAQPPIFFVHQKTSQKLQPEGLDATFELTLDSLPGSLREVVCECDPVLRLRDVVGPGIEGCSFQAGDKNNPSRLTIRLREPVRAGTWKILCLAPLTEVAEQSPVPASPSGEGHSIAWQSPGLRVVNGVPRGETLTLLLDPDLRLESWDPGSYRISASDIDRLTGFQVLTLLGGGLGQLHRPSVRLQAYGVDFSTQQLTWWRCNAGGMGVTVQIGWDVSQGQLFQLPVQLPAGWEVEKIEMAPASLLRDWHVRKTPGKAMLLVNLANPLGPRPASDNDRAGEPTLRPSILSSGRSGGSRLPSLTVQLRPTESGQITDKELPFPDATPIGARFREGVLALNCDEQLFHLQVATTAERSEPESEGPWGQQLPEYYYRYSGQSITGKLVVRPRPPRLRAKCDSEVLVAAGEAVVETHLLLEAEAGSPSTIDLAFSAGDGGEWSWRTESPRSEETTANRVRRAERVYTNETSLALHALAASRPLQAAVVMATHPISERWRLTLARPLRAREPLRLTAQHRLQQRENRWEVPLPLVLGAERLEGEVVLHLADAGLALVQSIGLHESTTSGDRSITPWRTFRYGQGPLSLTLSGQARASDRSSVAAIEKARLITYVGAKGDLRHHFSFEVSNWSEKTLPLRLPAGSRPLAVQVDGRWLPHLIPTDQDTSSSDQSVPLELALPVPNRPATSGLKPHFFEIVYTNSRSVALWQKLDAPPPQLPIAPLAFRRAWRLSPELAPLHQERCQRQPGTAEQLAILPHHLVDLFHLPGPLARFDPLREDRQMGTHEALKQAEQKLYERHADQTISLAEVMSDLAFDYLKDRYNLIIDSLALREAGVGAETHLTIKRLSSLGEAMPWAECGLRVLPAHSAILLTTNSGRGGALHAPFSKELEDALAEAARYGQDASGHFQSALNWLDPENRAVSADIRTQRLDFGYEGGDWDEWEPIAGLVDEHFIVVRRDGVTVVGLAFGLLLALLFGWPRQGMLRRRLTFMLIALALLGLGVLWLPASLRDLAWWPMLAVSTVAAFVYLGRVIRRPASPRAAQEQSKNIASVAAVAGLLALAMFGWSGRAAAPAPATVYLLPAIGDAPDKQTVLVPTDLLDRLKTLAQPAPLTDSGPQSVLLDAAYEGHLMDEGKQAEFTTVFSAYSLRDEPSALVVPLAGVQLVGDVLLDGARAAPLAAPQAGYSLGVRGRGRHKIELRFRVPVIGTEEDRNVLFSTPPLLRSRLSWRVPAGAVEPQILVKNGAQWMTRERGEQLQADLGSLPLPVHLHWHQPGRLTRVSYQAAYLWDLGLEVNRLTAYLRYRVEQGAVKTLEVDLPAELEISAAHAQRTLAVSRPSWRSRFQLRTWHVERSGNQSVLHLELPYPISGDLQVTLELLPRAPLASPATLSLPSPRGIDAGGPSYLAYRTQPGLRAQRETSQNLTRIGNDEFALDWLGGPSLVANFQGIAFRIPPDKVPQLLLRLEHAPPLIQGDLDVTVRVDSHRAEIETVAEITAPDKDLAALEWELPPHCVLLAATGDDVRTWKQSGSRLLVWLNRTTTKTRIHLNGLLPLSVRDGRSHLLLDGPRLLQADKLRTRLRLVTAGDLIVSAVQTKNLQRSKAEVRSPKLEGRSKDEILDFETSNAFYMLDCQVQAAANANARVLTFVEVVDRELRFTTTVDYTVTRGELRQVRLRLRSWEGEKVEVLAEQVALRSGPRRVAGERSWQLPLQAGIRGHYQVTLRGGVPLEKTTGGVPMPEVRVQDVEHAEYFVAAAGGELTSKANGSVQLLKPENKTPHPDPGIAKVMQRGGQVWLINGSEWQVRLFPQAQERNASPVRLYLLEQWAAVEDGRRWLHEARFWLHHEAHANLILDFAAPVRVLASTIDHVEPTLRSETRDPIFEAPLSDSELGVRISDVNKRVWLHLPGQAGVRCVRLRWMYDPPEPLDRPNCASPNLADATRGPIAQTIMVPPGWRASLAGISGWKGAAREAELALWRADAQLRISQDLARERRDSAAPSVLVDAQKRFDLYCRHAQRALDLNADTVEITGQRRQELAHWLEDLQAKNRSLKSETRKPKSEIASSDADFGLRVPGLERADGIPLSWQVLPHGEAPTLQLISRKSQEIRHALIVSVQWLGVLTVVWALSLLPFVRTRLRLLWPEQIALLGVIGWWLAGLTSIVMGLLILAACSRAYLLARGLNAFVQKRRHQPSPTTPGQGVAS